MQIGLLYLLITFLAGGILTLIAAAYHYGAIIRAKESELDYLTERSHRDETKLNELEELNRKLNLQIATAQTELNLLKAQIQKAEEQEARSAERLKESFQLIAAEHLEKNRKQLLDTNRSSVSEVLKPFQERIADFEKRVSTTFEKGTRERSSLNQQIKDLRDLNLQLGEEAKQLTLALKGDNKVQGNWGEMQLESLLQKAGLVSGVHYMREKQSTGTEGEILRPDFIINLPDEKYLVIDSKVSLTAYMNYQVADGEEAKTCLKQHLQSLSKHIKSLGSKNYSSLHSINPPDYVMLFLAVEPALYLALREKPELFDTALANNVVLVSNSTLLATLRTIAYIWTQENQSKNAQEIARQAGALYDKFSNFVADLNKIGDRLDQGQAAYHDAMKKLSTGRGNLLKKSERLKELGAKTSKQLPDSLSAHQEEE